MHEGMLSICPTERPGTSAPDEKTKRPSHVSLDNGAFVYTWNVSAYRPAVHTRHVYTWNIRRARYYNRTCQSRAIRKRLSGWEDSLSERRDLRAAFWTGGYELCIGCGLYNIRATTVRYIPAVYTIGDWGKLYDLGVGWGIEDFDPPATLENDLPFIFEARRQVETEICMFALQEQAYFGFDVVELRGINGKASKGYRRMNVVDEGGHSKLDVRSKPKYVCSRRANLFRI